jgi:hypothetical protein
VRADDKGGKRVIRIEGADFIGRFLQHVLPPGFKRIRHYGLLSPARKRKRLAAARHALDMPAPSPPALEAAAQFMKRVAQQDIERCPGCGQGILQVVLVMPPRRTSLLWPTSTTHGPSPCRGPPAASLS